jgi:hypothetical protein
MAMIFGSGLAARKLPHLAQQDTMTRAPLESMERRKRSDLGNLAESSMSRIDAPSQFRGWRFCQTLSKAGSGSIRKL